jgi:phosphatidylglycerophosphate synthase
MISVMGPAPAYTPTSRRPIAGVFRKTAGAAVRFCVARNVHPDVISYLSIVAAAIAATCYLWSPYWRPWPLAVAPLLLFLRLWFNMLDGMVALASGKASRRGEIINELPDRISDILIFAAVAHSGWVWPPLGYWCAILAVMTAYVGILGQAVTGRRRFEGWMSKQYRMVALAVGTWITLFTYPSGKLGDARAWGSPCTVLEWTCWVIIVGCIQTIVVRLVHILRDLNRPEGTP